jgi:hypothetical protein
MALLMACEMREPVGVRCGDPCDEEANQCGKDAKGEEFYGQVAGTSRRGAQTVDSEFQEELN